MFSIHLSPREARAFITMTPLILISSSEEDKMEAMGLLGYENPVLFLNAITTRNNIRDAFRVALLLVSMKEHSEELNQFFGKIEFRDRDIERKWKEHFEIHNDPNSLSVGELHRMWKLKSKYDDGGIRIIK
jgi:hypothetical protein